MLRALAVLLLAAFLWHVAPSPELHIKKQVGQVASAQSVTAADKTAAPLQGGQSQPEKQAAHEVVATPPPAPQPVLTQHEQWMQDAGIAQSDWSAVDYIISHESGWCATKWEGEIGYCPGQYAETYSTESTSRGYGLCQSTPAIKMATVAIDWQTNPVTQLKWCSTHADGKGGWQASYVYWVAHRNW